MRELRSEWRELGAKRPFKLRIGINTGYCTVGNFGSEDHMGHTIIGNNMIARLQSHAEVDSIPIGHDSLVATEEQSPIKVKGFAEPTRCYKVEVQDPAFEPALAPWRRMPPRRRGKGLL